eukprot:Ihof_evm2s834 gene=Ihof_evmTU2s834
MAAYLISKIFTMVAMVVNRPMFNMSPMSTTIGAFFEQEIKSCANFSLSCGVNQLCIDSITGPTCTCVAGYEFSNNMCQDINECFIHPGICGSTALCGSTLGNYTCHSCLKGHRVVDGICQNIDECSESPTVCNGNAICSSTIGNYVFTSCPWGFLAVNGTCQ